MTTVSNRIFSLQALAAVGLAASVCSTALGATGKSTDAQLGRGITAAQVCEAEIDDDLTSFGECIGHAADRHANQRLSLLGLYFQAWLMADLAARQGSPRSAQLRQRYQQALQRSLRGTGLTLQQLCKVKNLDCTPIQARLNQQIAPN